MSTSTKMKPSKGGGAQVSVGSGAASVRAYGNPLPYIAPWMVALVLLMLAWPVRSVLAKDSYSWFWSLACASGYMTLTVGVFLASRPRGRLTNAVATFGTGAASAWSWYVAGVPNFTWRPLAVYLIGMIVACGVSNALSAFRQGGQPGPTMHERLARKLEEVRTINAPQVVNGSVVAEIEAEPGSSVRQLQKEVPAALESMHDLPEGSVRITPGRPGSSTRRGQVRLSPINYLADPARYTGPSMRSGGPYGFGTIMDPLTTGRRQGGQPLQLHLPGDPKTGRNASLIQVTGMSGAGKSEFIRGLLLEAMSRGGADVFEYWYLNARKADQEPGWVRRGAARFESDKKGVIAALRDLRDEMPARAKLLGSRFDPWQPGAPLPLRLVVADEFAAVAPDVERLLVDLAETLRSLGVILLAGFQRATGDRFPTSARSNFGTHVCFGVLDDVDASMGLPDNVLEVLGEAGPWRWGNKQPGMCYLTAPGVPEQLWTEEARTWRPDKDAQQRWAQYLIALRNGQASTAPQTVDPHVEEAEVADDELVDVGTQPSEAPSNVIDLDRFDDRAAAEEAKDIVEDTLQDDPGAEDDEELVRPSVPADVADVHEVDHQVPIEVDGGAMRLRVPPRMPPERARQYLIEHLIGLRRAGASTVKMEDFGEDVLAVTGMSGSWLIKWLHRISEDQGGLLRKLDDRGWYEFRPQRR